MQENYTTPELVRFGAIAALTGHCSDGCDHDSLLHPDEFKSTDTEIQRAETC